MQRETNRFVIGRENNVVRVDFSRDPDPPAPRFPGASGLREVGDESASETKYISGLALSAASASFLILIPVNAIYFIPWEQTNKSNKRRVAHG
jgi:hypothetical protein